MSRSSDILKAVAAMQAAARAAAVSGASNLVGSTPVSDGFTQMTSTGLAQPTSNPGLQIAVNSQGTPVQWQGAGLPTTGSGSTANQVTIVQNQSQALLRWQSFDVGKNTTLTFDQSAGGANAGQWIAFNLISDPTGRPSQILGSINTIGLPDSNGIPQVGGQVYVINPNGIIFGGSSQVNAHSLVASSLPINPNLISSGLLNDTSNYQFLFSSSDITVGGQQTAVGVDAFGDSSSSPNYVPPPPSGGYGNVTVQPGAQLTSPAEAGNVGGAVILVGPNVTNAGTISTPYGQTILAAGLQVGLTAHDNIDPTRTGVEVTNGVPSQPTAGSADDPSLRGLDVYVGAVVEPSSGTAGSSPKYVSQSDGGTGISTSGWSGIVTNENVGGQGSVLGVIEAPEGNVTMAGAVVNQLGIIDSRTSVSLNGRIDLLATYNSAVLPGQLLTNSSYEPFAPQSSGVVNFGPDSVTQILADTSGGTVVGTQLTLPSQIYVQAHSVYVGGTGPGDGAIVLAPSGYVSMSAGDWEAGGPGETQLNLDSGQIYVDDGASIDVSGSQNVSASVSENIVTMQLRGPELADSPLQQGGPLQGTTVQIDITQTGTYDGQPWVGTPLALTNGYIGLIQRSIGELTTGGGSVNLSAGGSVVLNPGSTVNVSGGWINYAGAVVGTTDLLSGGRIYSIADATPNLTYTGIYTGTTSQTDSKWGVTQTSTNAIPLTSYENGYIQGGSGGSLTITAPSIAPEGNLLGYVVDGQRQVNAPNAASLAAAEAAGIDPNIWLLSTIPTQSRLSLLLQGQESIPSLGEAWFSPTPPAVTIAATGAGAATVGPFDPNGTGTSSTWSSTNIQLSPALFAGAGSGTTSGSGGFGTLNLENSDGSVSIPASGTALAAVLLPPGGSMTIAAANIDVEGGISAPNGSLNFLAYGFSPYQTAIDLISGGSQSYSSTRGNFTLGPLASLDVSGMTIDDRVAISPKLDSGGSVVIKGNNIDLEAGSTINVSGGAIVSAAGSVSYGGAGSIQISSGQDPFAGSAAINNDGTTNASAISSAATDSILGGGLALEATLEGFGGTGGGKIGIQAPTIQIGGTEPVTAETSSDGLLPTTLWLEGGDNVSFFSEGGFSSFSLTGIGETSSGLAGITYTPGLVVEPSTYIHPVVETWLADTSTGVSLSPQTLAYGMRPAVTITLAAAGARNSLNSDPTANLVVRGDLVMGAGSSIVLDPVGSASNPTPTVASQGTVTLKGDTVDVGGTISVPGGTINIVGDQSLPAIGLSTIAYPTVALESGSILSASGTSVLVADQFGRVPGETGYLSTGSVLGGGFITVEGNIVAQGGAELLANGSTGTFYLPVTYTQAVPLGENMNQVQNLALTRIDTNGGSITLAAGQELFSAASFSAVSGNASDPLVTGGSLWVFGQYFSPVAQHPFSTALDAAMAVTATPIAFTYTSFPSSPQAVALDGATASPVLTNGNVSQPLTFIDAASINAGGFSSVVLQAPGALSDANAVKVTGPSTQNAIVFQGNLTLGPAGSLTVAGSGVFFADGAVTLTADYVDLGAAFASPTVLTTPLANPLLVASPPTSGPGSLNVTASQLIDVSNVSLQGISTATLDAGAGAIRGDGTLDIAGDLTLRAAQIYPPTEVAFNIAAYPGTQGSGSVTIESGGAASQLPLSAGGELSIYADTIVQGGTLEAPMGVINLGSSSTAIDPLTGQAFPATTTVTLASGSVTSTSDATNALTNSSTGAIEPVPYGLYVNGTGWIDPAGSNITILGNGILGAGLPAKTVNLAAANIDIQPASGSLAAAALDVSGGGDLLAYQWIPGNGGTKDVLAPSLTGTAPTGFAIIPGYTAAYAPFGPYGASNSIANGLSDLGYTNSAQTGAEIYLNAANAVGLPAGTYTLLPARYALLPGSYLVTLESGTPVANAVQPDSSEIVSGYVLNGFTGAVTTSPLYVNVDVAPASVVKRLAEYTVYSAGTVFPQQAVAQDVATPRLPVDAGLVAIDASATVNLQGTVDGGAGAGGRGSVVEISGPPDAPIIIDPGGAGTTTGALYLSSSQLSSFGSEGLLIGGSLDLEPSGSVVNVVTDTLEVQSGSTLAAADVVLVANDALTIDSGAIVQAEGAATTSLGDLVFGQSSDPGSGNGILLRVSRDPQAQFSRLGVTPFVGNPTLTVSANAQILGGAGSTTLDSTSTAIVDPSATIAAAAISVGSGQVALQLDPAAALPSGSQALVLTSNALQSLQTPGSSLSLLSYTSIDLYGSGQVGAVDSSNQPTLASLSLHAGEIRGFSAAGPVGGDVTFNAKNILLDNGPGAVGAGPASSSMPGAGTLTFNGDLISIGLANTLNVDQFGALSLEASTGIVLSGSGGSTNGLLAQGSLSLQTPVVTTAAAASGILSAQGAVSLSSSASSPSTTPGGGIGSNLTLVGSSVSVGENTSIMTPSGNLTLHATSGDVTVAGNVEAEGSAQQLGTATEYTNGGQVQLVADAGDVVIVSGGAVSVAAQTDGGSGGTLTVSAPLGGLTASGTISGGGGLGGQNGAASIDVLGLRDTSGNPTTALDPLEGALVSGGFTRSQAIRVRAGDVSLGDTATVANFDLSADSGSILVSGTIDASGPVGGAISLSAGNSVVLEGGATLNVQGQNYNDAGKGGSVALSAGTSQFDASGDYLPNPSALVTISPNSTINLGVVNNQPLQLNLSGQSSITVAAGQPVTFPSGTPGDDQVTFGSAGTLTTAAGAATSFGAGYTTPVASGTVVVFSGSGSGMISFAANGSGGGIPVALPAGAALAQSGVTDLTLYYSTGTLTLRAPQVLTGGLPTDVQISPINGTILNPSSIVIEGYQVFVPTGGSIDSVEGAVQTNGAEFTGGINAMGVLVPGNTQAIVARLTASWGSGGGQVNPNLSTQPDLLVHVQPGAEIDNPAGSLTLQDSWDLSTYRFGPNATDSSGNPILGAGEPGTLTLRAAGNIMFAYDPEAPNTNVFGTISGGYASLSDGFGLSSSGGTPSQPALPGSLWEDPLLPPGSASWSYQIVAGADFNAASYSRVISGAGSVQLGSTTVAPTPVEQLVGPLTRDIVVPEYYQVVRTGTGNISIYSGLDIQSLNPLATIYTAGQQAPAMAGFQAPDLAYNGNNYTGPNQLPVYPAQYSFGGGDVTLNAERDILQDQVVGGQVVSAATEEMPTNWLYRQGYTDGSGNFAVVPSSVAPLRRGTAPNRPGTPNVASTSWWVDFSNYFEGIGALGGGNVSLIAGGMISNIDAAVPTNERMPGVDPSTGNPIAPSAAASLELGGGDLLLSSGGDISGGVYYVERGEGALNAGGQITTNAARTTLPLAQVATLPLGTDPDPATWLPTTLFAGNSTYTVNADGDVKLGAVVNPFLLPQGINNSFWEKTYFSTYSSQASVSVTSLTGDVTLADNPQVEPEGASLYSWYNLLLALSSAQSPYASDSVAEPWLLLAESNVATSYSSSITYPTTVFGLMPPALRATAFSGDVNIVGSLTLSPSSTGTIDLLAGGSVNGLQINGIEQLGANTNEYQWSSAVINVSDADPSRIPGLTTPLSVTDTPTGVAAVEWWANTGYNLMAPVDVLINESSSFESPTSPLQQREALNAPGVLHANDTDPVRLEAGSGDISGITLFSPKPAIINAGEDITDIAFYLENNSASDISVITAGRDLIAYDPTAPLLQEAQFPVGVNQLQGGVLSGDIQISGPGTLEVLTGRNLNLGVGTASGGTPSATISGIASVGDGGNPYLPFGGADIVAAAGLDGGGDLSNSKLGFSAFISDFIDPTAAGANAARYLPELAAMVGQAVSTGETAADIWTALQAPYSSDSAAAQTEHEDLLALDAFYVVLRDAGRDQGNSASPYFGAYTQGDKAIADLFPGSATTLAGAANSPWSGSISLATREIVTTNGGNIAVAAPGGGLTVGNPGDPQKPDQGLLTEFGGNISIFTQNDSEVGTSRIFTLRGGSEIIWSSIGSIAAGSGSKTVFSAPPTRVIVDPQSATVQNDLAGLATGSGIGVLATLAGVAPGNVDLIAPVGTVDAGDAGIRSSGNLNIAALHVVNASNIQVGGVSSGVPVAAPPNVGAFTTAANSVAATSTTSTQVASRQQSDTQSTETIVPSVISVEVLGYGGGDEFSTDVDKPSESVRRQG